MLGLFFVAQMEPQQINESNILRCSNSSTVHFPFPLHFFVKIQILCISSLLDDEDDDEMCMHQQQPIWRQDPCSWGQSVNP